MQPFRYKKTNCIKVVVKVDSGISGTSVKKRTEFLRMLDDCEKGKINLILCKSVSRFARNTVDLLRTIRRLKELGIDVRFEKENISTLSKDGELMLTVLASFSQEESRSISDNVKWGIRKRFQAGTIGTANKHILGYRYDEDADCYVIIPEEAETVRWMFQMFLDGLPFQKIADNLNNANITTTLGNNFQEASVRLLLYNEIYAGDILRQKSHTPDPISKHKLKNSGTLPQYLYTDCHEAIIDRETYEKVKAEMKRRATLQPPVYFFTGLIHCETCGNIYTRKKQFQRGHLYTHWICRNKKEKGVTCSSCNFREEELIAACKKAVGSDYEKRIISISVTAYGDIIFTLLGGETKFWKNMHLKPVTHPHTVTDAFQGRIICSKCGYTYHRVNAGNKWCYWYCMGKRHAVHCDNVTYTDYQLRTISAYVLGVDDFDEEIFNMQIDHIDVTENGSLNFIFKDGRNILWKRA